MSANKLSASHYHQLFAMRWGVKSYPVWPNLISSIFYLFTAYLMKLSVAQTTK
jgi:hypothetical protein